MPKDLAQAAQRAPLRSLLFALRFLMVPVTSAQETSFPGILILLLAANPGHIPVGYLHGKLQGLNPSSANNEDNSPVWP